MAQNIDRSTAAVDLALEELARGRSTWANTPPPRRIELLESCVRGVGTAAEEWVRLSCQHKGIANDAPVAGEEIGAGPFATARHLRLLVEGQRSIAAGTLPALPGPRRDRWVPVFPTRSLADRWLFRGYRAEVLLGDDGPAQAAPPTSAGTCVVLGAGNVSSLPCTDLLHQLFHEGRPVLLKLNPVNDYLLPVFDEVFASLIDHGVLRIVRGDETVGNHALHHELVEKVHLTGSAATHDRIVAGPPPLTKTITSELGNVTPVVIYPAKYSSGALAYHAESVATMLTNNAAFNCVAGQLLVTWQRWPQRQRFLDLVQDCLEAIQPRRAYYPGARERFARLLPEISPPDDGTLPWVLLRDLQEDSPLLREECFVSIAGEIALPAASESAFARAATDFLNDRVAGSLGTTWIAPPDTDLGDAIDRLWYGTIAINHWCAMGFALVSPPWGGYPGGTPDDPGSGIGFVHNTYFLRNPVKTVIHGPFRARPRPPWFATHRHAAECMWGLCRYYVDGRWRHLPRILLAAMRS